MPVRIGPFVVLLTTMSPVRAEPPVVERAEILRGEAEWDWTQVRTAFVPGEEPLWVTTASRTAREGAHGYHDVYVSTSRDGRAWTEPEFVPALRRREREDGYEVVPGDLWPKWHAATKRVLVTGKTFNFEGGTKENILREQVSYAVYDPAADSWGPLRMLEMPKRDHAGRPIIAPNAGCHQRVDLPNGDILLPVRYQTSERKRIYTTIVARCRFDGTTLTYVEHGSEHDIPTGRGLYEPSVIRFGDRFLLTMRANDGAWVAVGEDGVNFDEHRPWTFDDGEPLGSENTQQHWVTVGGRLYLVYTRRGANNDHIFRHRAPLFLAEVDPSKPCVIRATERVLVTENDATLGNSGVCWINDDETWVTVAEGRVTLGPRKGERNKVFVARIRAAGD